MNNITRNITRNTSKNAINITKIFKEISDGNGYNSIKQLLIANTVNNNNNNANHNHNNANYNFNLNHNHNPNLNNNLNPNLNHNLNHNSSFNPSVMDTLKNQFVGGMNLLMQAGKVGREPNIINLLLNDKTFNFDIDAENSNQNTALIIASKENNTEFALKLIQNNADVLVKNNEEKDALYYSAKNNNVVLFNKLFNIIKNSKDYYISYDFITLIINNKNLNKEIYIPLIDRILLDSPFYTDEIVFNLIKNDSTDIALYVLNKLKTENNIVFKDVITRIDENGNSPLFDAVKNKNYSLIKIILEGNEEEGMLQDYSNILEYVAQKDDTNLMETLLKHIKIKKEDDILKYAINNKNPKMFNLLITNGAEPKESDNLDFKVSSKENADTILLYNIKSKNNTIAKKLIDLGAKIDARDSDGFDALGVGLALKNQEIVNTIAEKLDGENFYLDYYDENPNSKLMKFFAKIIYDKNETIIDLMDRDTIAFNMPNLISILVNDFFLNFKGTPQELKNIIEPFEPIFGNAFYFALISHKKFSEEKRLLLIKEFFPCLEIETIFDKICVLKTAFALTRYSKNNKLKYYNLINNLLNMANNDFRNTENFYVKTCYEELLEETIYTDNHYIANLLIAKYNIMPPKEYLEGFLLFFMDNDCVDSFLALMNHYNVSPDYELKIAKLGFSGEEPCNLLDYAIFSDKPNFVEALLNMGANVNYTSEHIVSKPIMFFNGKKINEEARNQILDNLIQHGATIDDIENCFIIELFNVLLNFASEEKIDKLIQNFDRFKEKVSIAVKDQPRKIAKFTDEQKKRFRCYLSTKNIENYVKSREQKKQEDNYFRNLISNKSNNNYKDQSIDLQ